MLVLSLLGALAAALAPLPAGTVVVGEGDIDGRATGIVALLPDGTRRSLGVEVHRPGRLPPGVLDPVDGRTLALTVLTERGEGAQVVILDVVTGGRRVVGDGAIALQAPVLLEDAVLFVRADERPERSTFDVLRVPRAGADPGAAPGADPEGAAEVVASTTGAWLTPVAGAPGRFLHLDEAGQHRIVTLAAARLEPIVALGRGRLRAPVLVGQRVFFERVGDKGSEIVEATVPGGRRVLARGLPGMDPLLVPVAAVPGTSATSTPVVVHGTGEKRAGLQVLRLDETGRLDKEDRLDGGRAGVATPRAAARAGDAVLVVVWLDRGRALPGELWLWSTAAAPRRLLAPRPGLVVEVYGVVGLPGNARAGDGR